MRCRRSQPASAGPDGSTVADDACDATATRASVSSLHSGLGRLPGRFVAGALPGPVGFGNVLRSTRANLHTAEDLMKTLLAIVAWCLLFVLCWPLALLALVLWPVAWLLALPFRLVGITFSALFAFLQALLFLPARLLGGRSGPTSVRRAVAG